MRDGGRVQILHTLQGEPCQRLPPGTFIIFIITIITVLTIVIILIILTVLIILIKFRLDSTLAPPARDLAMSAFFTGVVSFSTSLALGYDDDDDCNDDDDDDD